MVGTKEKPRDLATLEPEARDSKNRGRPEGFVPRKRWDYLPPKKRSGKRRGSLEIGKEFGGVIYWSPYNVLSLTDRDGKKFPKEFLEVLGVC